MGEGGIALGQLSGDPCWPAWRSKHPDLRRARRAVLRAYEELAPTALAPALDVGRPEAAGDDLAPHLARARAELLHGLEGEL